MVTPINLIGKKFPKFTAPCVMPNNEIIDIDIENYFQGHIGVIVFYPLNFTYVCPSELIALDEAMPHFERLGARVVAISVDSAYAHLQWRNMCRKEGGVGQLRFPMISDIGRTITDSYGVCSFEQPVALRATFIIDSLSSHVVHQSINDLSVGRSVPELIRTIAAFIAQRSGQVCPANWNEGDDLMDPTIRGVIAYIQSKS